ncbi:uncharacterized protein LOC134814318 [Bolinopsis microptera]|uniref:uncharacterized protein LOC134814318 n=1 Tax=Bolinopsis microptera TaxID=2820187 RepID=UPI00307AB318
MVEVAPLLEKQPWSLRNCLCNPGRCGTVSGRDGRGGPLAGEATLDAAELSLVGDGRGGPLAGEATLDAAELSLVGDGRGGPLAGEATLDAAELSLVGDGRSGPLAGEATLVAAELSLVGDGRGGPLAGEATLDATELSLVGDGRGGPLAGEATLVAAELSLVGDGRGGPLAGEATLDAAELSLVGDGRGGPLAGEATLDAAELSLVGDGRGGPLAGEATLDAAELSLEGDGRGGPLAGEATLDAAELSLVGDGRGGPLAGEATLVAAELSLVGDGRGGPLAIDKEFTTSAKVKPGTDKRIWLKVSLDQIYCVRQVIEYERDETVQFKWTCSQENCGDCEGDNCDAFELKVYVEGVLPETLPSYSGCKHGNRVQLEKTGGNKDYFIVFEIAVIATKARCLSATWTAVTMEPPLPVNEGTSVTFSCPRRYLKEGSQTGTCQDGLLRLEKSEDPPTCLKIDFLRDCYHIVVICLLTPGIRIFSSMTSR